MGKLFSGWGIRLIIIAVIVGGGFVLRDRLSSNAGDLQVGDCFDNPGTEEIKDVQHHPCTEAHTGEVIFIGNMNGANESYPTDDAFVDYIGANCLPAFNSYTGMDYQTATEFDFGSYTPSKDGWGDGDREVACFLVRTDNGTMSKSYKAATQ
jgi:hypothetical protein